MASSIFIGFVGGIKYTTSGSAVSWAGSLLPDADNTYDLGSASFQWRTAYLGTGAILADAGTLQFGTTTPAILSRGAANRLDLASGDSLYVVSGGLGVGVLETSAGNLSASGNILLSTAGTYFTTTTGRITNGTATGHLNLVNFAATTGIGLDVSTDSVLAIRDRAQTGVGRITFPGANGQVFNEVQQLTELTTITTAASTDTAIQMPANSVVLGVSVRVTVEIPTAATFTVGDSGSAARFSTAAVSTAATSTDPGTKAGAYYNASALAIRITPDVSPAAATGRVRVTIYYYSITPPTG